MYILGINAYHGSASACLIKDGQLIAAAEEERFNRIKYWASFPTQSIRYVLSEAGIACNPNANPLISRLHQNRVIQHYYGACPLW
jgi:carbamoyltransferase